MRAEFLNAGFEAELALELNPPAPWEEVKDQVLQQLYPTPDMGEKILDPHRWEPLPTSEDLAKRGFRFGGELGPDELNEIDRIADSFDSPLVQASYTFVDLVRMSVAQKISEGDVSIGPHLLPPRTELDDVIWQGLAIHEGWAVSYALLGKDFPEVAEQQTLLGALKHERHQSIQAFLDSLYR